MTRHVMQSGTDSLLDTGDKRQIYIYADLLDGMALLLLGML